MCSFALLIVASFSVHIHIQTAAVVMAMTIGIVCAGPPLDALQAGYDYPQGRPQLAPGSHQHRLLESTPYQPEAHIRFPPLNSDQPPQPQFHTVTTLGHIPSSISYTPQYEAVVDAPALDEEFPSDVHDSAQQPPPQEVTQQYRIVAQALTAADDVFVLEFDVPADYHVTTEWGNRQPALGFAPALPPSVAAAASFDAVTGYEYAVPNNPSQQFE